MEPIAFLCCLEAGRIAEMSLRLLESLRLFGGTLSRAPFYGIRSRIGPPLKADQLESWASLNGKIIDLPGPRRHDWYHYLCKARTIEIAENRIKAKTLAFLDSDTLIVREPQLLLTDAGELRAVPTFNSSFGARPNRKGEWQLWHRLAQEAQIDLNQLPQCQDTTGPYFLQFNAGVFSFQQGYDYGKTFRELVVRFLEGKRAHPGFGVHSFDEIAATFALPASNLRFKSLPSEYNTPIPCWSDKKWSTKTLKGATVLHYHAAMNDRYWTRFLEMLAECHPRVHTWIKDKGPLPTERKRRTLTQNYFRLERSLRRWWHLKRCHYVDRAA